MKMGFSGIGTGYVPLPHTREKSPPDKGGANHHVNAETPNIQSLKYFPIPKSEFITAPSQFISVV